MMQPSGLSWRLPLAVVLASCWLTGAVTAAPIDELIDALRERLPSDALLTYEQADGDPVADTARLVDLKITSPGRSLTIARAELAGVKLDADRHLEQIGRLNLSNSVLEVTSLAKLTVRELRLDNLTAPALDSLLSGAIDPTALAGLDLDDLSATGVAMGMKAGFATADRIGISSIEAGRVAGLDVENVLVTFSGADRLTIERLGWRGLSLELLARQAQLRDGGAKRDIGDLRAFNEAIKAALPTSFTLEHASLGDQDRAVQVEAIRMRSFVDEQTLIAFEAALGPIVVPTELLDEARSGITPLALGSEPSISLMVNGSGTYDIESLVSRVDMTAGADGQGHLHLELAGRALELLDQELATALQGDLPEPALIELEAAYRDEGAVRSMLDGLAGAMGVDRPTLAVQLMTFARLPLAHAMTPRLAAALTGIETFMGQPDELRIIMRPTTPVAIEQMLALGLLDPGTLGENLALEITAGPPR